MAVPSNITPQTATAVNALPFTDTLDVSEAPSGTGYEPSCTGAPEANAVWYRFAANAQGVLAISADPAMAGTYEPRISIWTGTPPALTQLEIDGQDFCGDTSGDNPFLVPMAAGTTYYIQVVNTTETTPDADLVFAVTAAPCTATIPAGSLLIVDDSEGFPAAAIDATSGEILRYIQAPATENIAQLDDGTLCFGTNVAPYSTVTITTSQMVAINSVDLTDNVIGIKAANNKFWVVTSNVTQTIHRLSGLGIVEDSWALPNQLDGFAISPNGAAVYYVPSLTLSAPVNQFLFSGSINTVIATGPADRWFLGKGDGWCDAFTNVYFGYTAELVEAPSGITKYNSAGTFIRDYEVLAMGTDELNHIQPDPDDLTMWAWVLEAFNVSTWYQILISDGSIVNTFSQPTISVSGESAPPPDGPFGVSNSCPLMILNTPITGLSCLAATAPVSNITHECGTNDLVITGSGFSDDPGVVVSINGVEIDDFTISHTSSTSITVTLDTPFQAGTYCATVDDVGPALCVPLSCAGPVPPDGTHFEIRRVRRVPHVSNDGNRIFHQRLELQMQPGIGKTTGQGSEPVVFLRTSNDGGNTWSTPRTASPGPQGSYFSRVYWTQLGMSRDRVYEVSFSDPVVGWVIVQAWIQIEQGTN